MPGAIAESGAEELITACPECYHTLGTEYARYGIELPVKVTHMHAFLEREIEKGAVALQAAGGARRPFRMPAARAVWAETGRFRESSSSAFARTTRNRSSHRMRRASAAATAPGPAATRSASSCRSSDFEQARQSGSELMITACPKCQIHLRCAMEDALQGEELKMEMIDLTSAIAKSIHWA